MLRILLVEDSADDAELLRLALEESGMAVHLSRVGKRADLLQALQQDGWDLLICDHNLPDLDALAILALVAASRSSAGRPALPCLVLSGEISEQEALAALANGARACLSKDALHELVPTLQREAARLRLPGDTYASHGGQAPAAPPPGNDDLRH